MLRVGFVVSVIIVSTEVQFLFRVRVGCRFAVRIRVRFAGRGSVFRDKVRVSVISIGTQVEF